jgi:hypothetical protein
MNTISKTCILLFFLVNSVILRAAIKNPVHDAFVENKGQLHNQHGQSNPDVLYMYSGKEMNVQIRALGFGYEYRTFHFASAQHNRKNNQPLPHPRPERIDIQRVDIDFLGANKDCEILALDTLSWYKNYKNEFTPDLGINGVRIFQTIMVKNVYPGIDLQYQVLDHGQFKFDFIVHSGGDINRIKWKYRGADSVTHTSSQISLHFPGNVVSETVPSSYTLETGDLVDIRYRKTGLNEFGFEAPKRLQGTLLIDPVPTLLWCTYFGGSWDYTSDFETGLNTGFYFTGVTSTDNLATSGVYRDTLWDDPDYPWDTYIAKMNNAGTSILWCTYYGGDGIDDVVAIKVDGSNDIVISGYTNSDTGLSTIGAYRTSPPSTMLGSLDIFLAKFNDSGHIKWSTYLGGANSNICNSLGMDDKNNVYLSGWTSSGGLATSGVYQDTNRGNGDCFLCKMSPSGNLTWFTYFGGAGAESFLGADLAMYNSTIYMAGSTESSTNIATTGTYQTTKQGGQDGFLAKFDTTGNIVWATYLGGNNLDIFRNVACDGMGNVYMAGHTNSDSFLSYGNVHADTLTGNFDAVAASFTPAGAIRWSSYYGGIQDEWLGRANVNACGELMLVGSTYSENGIATTKAYDTLHGSAGLYADGFLVQFNDSGMVNYGTYLGFRDDAELLAASYDAKGHLFVGGGTYSDSMATSGAYQTAVSGYNAVLFMFDSVSTCPIVVLSADFTETRALRIPNEKALIKWTFVSSIDEPSVFEIYRRTAHHGFVQVGTVSAFSRQTGYHFTDNPKATENEVAYKIRYVSKNTQPVWSKVFALPDLSSEQVRLFPNPASQGVDVLIPPSLEATKIQLLDMVGREILSKAVAPGLLHLDIDHFPDGIYWVRLITTAGNMVFKLQIKQP